MEEFTVVMGNEATKMDPDHVPWPADSIVAFATNSDGSIKGRSAIIQLPHIEGTWVAESERGSTLAFRLVKRVEDVMKRAGKTHSFAFVETNQPDVLGYMLRMGYKISPFLVLNKEL